MNQNIKKFFALFALVLISACGGGRDDTVPPQPSMSYPVRAAMENAFKSELTRTLQTTGTFEEPGMQAPAPLPPISLSHTLGLKRVTTTEDGKEVEVPFTRTLIYPIIPLKSALPYLDHFQLLPDKLDEYYDPYPPDRFYGNAPWLSASTPLIFPENVSIREEAPLAIFYRSEDALGRPGTALKKITYSYLATVRLDGILDFQVIEKIYDTKTDNLIMTIRTTYAVTLGGRLYIASIKIDYKVGETKILITAQGESSLL